MKRTEKQIMDRFDDKAMMIDPKFRTNLRSQVVVASHGKKNQKTSRHWLRLAMVPAVAAVFVAVFIGLNLNKSGDIKHPLQPQKVSAAELVKRNADARMRFDPGKYTYSEIHSKKVAGPASPVLCPGYQTSTPQKMSEYDYNTYTYRAPDGGIEATYSKDTNDGVPTGSLGVYDTTPTRVFPEHVTEIVGESLESTLGLYYEDGVPFTLFYDAQGHPLADEKIAPTTKDGHSVYEFYFKSNPVALHIKPGDPSYDCSTAQLTYVVIDADSYELIERSGYTRTYAPENLTYKMTFSAIYKNYSEQEALRHMEAVGFNKQTASPTYPQGKDGPDLGSPQEM